MILQFSENSKRNRERDVNTLGSNTLRLLREVHNFVLFRIYGCMVQRSLTENINFVLYYFRKKLSHSSFGMVIHPSVCEWRTRCRSSIRRVRKLPDKSSRKVRLRTIGALRIRPHWRGYSS